MAVEINVLEDKKKHPHQKNPETEAVIRDIGQHNKYNSHFSQF